MGAYVIYQNEEFGYTAVSVCTASPTTVSAYTVSVCRHTTSIYTMFKYIRAACSKMHTKAMATGFSYLLLWDSIAFFCSKAGNTRLFRLAASVEVDDDVQPKDCSRTELPHFYGSETTRR